MPKFLVKSLAGIGVGAALAAGTFAFAEFTLGSGGDATGHVATPTSPSVSGTIKDALWPGDCSDVTFTFTNPSANKHAVDIINAYLTGVDTSASGVSPTFLKVNEGVGGSIPGAPGVTFSNGYVVQPGASTDITIANGVCLSPDAGDAASPGGNVIGGENISVNASVASTVEAGTAYAANASKLH